MNRPMHGLSLTHRAPIVRFRRGVSWTKKLLLYALRLGPMRGPWTLRRLGRGRGEVQVAVPGLKQPLHVRAGTSDVQSFQEVFLDLDYAIEPLRPPRLVVDVGANSGYSTVYFAHRFPDARVVAVEPEPANARLLRRNTAPFANVRTMVAALWPREAELTIENPGAAAWSFRMRESHAGETALVQGLPLPALLKAALGQSAGGTRIDLLKIDIEGAEMDLFSLPVPWLDQVDVLVIELHERYRPGCEEAVRSHFPPETFTCSRRGSNTILERRHTPRCASPT
jgi:FkbM family methyltransferase